MPIIAFKRSLPLLFAVAALAGNAPASHGADPKPTKTSPAAPAAAPFTRPFPFPNRIKSPSLEGGVDWLNTSGPIELQQLRGKYVILDFWTYCCINCMHVLPVLKQLEAAYPKNLVVIGVHSAKFDGEKDTQNIRDAIERYGIEHPVINDSDHRLWTKFEINSWPTIQLIDPEGNLVHGLSGEFSFSTIDRIIQLTLPYYREKGVLDESALRFDLEAYKSAATPLRYPGKILADERSGRLFIADSGHNRIVISKLDGTLISTVGSGVIGDDDGDIATTTFNHPQGMALRGETLYIADTEGHRLRKVDLKKETVKTIAGTGEQGLGWPGIERIADIADVPTKWVGTPLETKLNSPWALAISGNSLFIAMAGPHQIWKMPLDQSVIGPYAGNSVEDVVDGPLLPKIPQQMGFAAFAQPSGLTANNKWLFVADSEGSSIRQVPLDGKGRVQTLLGTAGLPEQRLFTFGDVDGDIRKARLQHPLDVCFAAGKLYVADTYNNKIKEIEIEKKTSRSIAGDIKSGNSDDPATFSQPAGLSHAAGKLYVADTNNHTIRTINLADHTVATLPITGLEPPKPKRAAAKTGPSFPDAKQVLFNTANFKREKGMIRLEMMLRFSENYKVNPLAPLKYLVESIDGKGAVGRTALGKLTAVEKPGNEFVIELPATEDGADKLKISISLYYCQANGGGLCKAKNLIATVPLTIAPDGNTTISLPIDIE